jgi:hypothetical protein
MHGDDLKESSESKEVCRKPQEHEKHMDTQQTLAAEDQYSSLLRHASIYRKSPTSQSIYSHPISTTTLQHSIQKIASTIPLPTAEPLQDQRQSVLIFIVKALTCTKTYPTNSGCRELCGRSSTIKSDSSDLRHIPLDQNHRSDWIWPAELGALPGQQPAVAAVDLPHPYTDYMVAAAEIDIPGEVHYRRVDMAQVDHYYTVQEGPPVMRPAFH